MQTTESTTAPKFKKLGEQVDKAIDKLLSGELSPKEANSLAKLAARSIRMKCKLRERDQELRAEYLKLQWAKLNKK